MAGVIAWEAPDAAHPARTAARESMAAVAEGRKDDWLALFAPDATVADRIAQTVVCMVLEPAAEPVFHPDSYGYRPGRSALHAVGKARRRCWENDWVIDMDIRAFFDTVPWDLVLRAVKHHSREPWVLLYVRRWLEAPLQLPDGTISERTMGTPQGNTT